MKLGNLIRLERLEIVIISAMFLMGGLLLYMTPPDMDEYVKFRSLACWRISDLWPEYHEKICRSLQINLLGVIPLQRAWAYVGATYSALYYPFQLIWPH